MSERVLRGSSSSRRASPSPPVAVAAAALALGLLSSAGCYRTHLVERDAAVSDAPYVVDAPRPERDAPPPDSACHADAECSAPDRCVRATEATPVDLLAVPLRCGDASVGLEDGARCERNAECGRGICALGGSCVVPCRTDDDCGSTQRCGRAWSIMTSYAMQWADVCLDWVSPPEGVEATVGPALELGASSSASFAIPPLRGQATFASVQFADRDDERYAMSVTTGEGEQVFDAWTFGIDRQPLSVGSDGHSISIAIPNGDRDFAPGTSLSVDVTGERPMGRTRSILLERLRAGSVLDVDVYYLASTETGEVVPPPDVEEMLASFGSRLEAIGLHLGELRHVVVPGATGRRFSTITDDDEVAELFRYSAGCRRPVLNLYVIWRSADFLGVAWGAPGAQAMHGLAGSGIIVSRADLRDVADYTFEGISGFVLAHEFGHFTGLNHTTEAEGDSLDPFEDTPQCDLASHDADGDGNLSAEECVDADGRNVMFWVVGENPDTGWSPRQSVIVRNTMVLR